MIRAVKFENLNQAWRQRASGHLKLDFFAKECLDCERSLFRLVHSLTQFALARLSWGLLARFALRRHHPEGLLEVAKGCLSYVAINIAGGLKTRLPWHEDVFHLVASWGSWKRSVYCRLCPYWRLVKSLILLLCHHHLLTWKDILNKRLVLKEWKNLRKIYLQKSSVCNECNENATVAMLSLSPSIAQWDNDHSYTTVAIKPYRYQSYLTIWYRKNI